MLVDVDGFPGVVKVRFVRRAIDAWPALADVVGVRPDERRRWAPGDEPRALWEWLEVRGALDRLPGACRRIGRPDLAEGFERPGPMMVPVANRVRIPRPELQEKVVAAFRRGVSPAVAVTTAVRGTGGFGKTTLAEMICADPEVQRAFPGGIVWVRVGSLIEGRVPGRIGEVTRELLGDPGIALDGDAGAQLAEVLGDEPALMVVDDVWTSGQLAPFLVGAPRCVRLITTRNAVTLPRGTSSVPVEAMLPDEARALLLAGLPDPGPDDERVDRVLTRTGRWPLLLGLVNGALERMVGQDNAIGAALAEVDLRLRESGPLDFDLEQAAARQDAVAGTLRVGLDLLPADDRLRYEELAVFPGDEPIPLTELVSWWGSTGGLGEAAVRKLCAGFADRSLIVRYQLNPARIHLHHVVVESLRRLVGERRLAEMRQRRASLRPPIAAAGLDDDDED